ncbi:hypothetical protein ACETK8_19970 (plasmid) [Brevundimonas staleyi]|uniref:Uncharacterized protein n=1 Tax=Brevundimonas staleyi TaxID=74326 RepID=A0ABW0FMG0_9CAUL
MWMIILSVVCVLVLLKPLAGAQRGRSSPARELYERRLRSGHEG